MMLVATDELETHLGVTFSAADTARATQIITKWSGVIQRYCNRVGLVRVADDEITLRGSYGPELHLPLGPVVSVSGVTVDGDVVDGYELVRDILLRTGQDDVDYPLARPFRRFGHWGGPDVEVVVTYTHGLDSVPDEAAAICLERAAQVFSNPTGASAISLDGYSVRYGERSARLNDDEKSALKSWHRSAHSADIS